MKMLIVLANKHLAPFATGSLARGGCQILHVPFKGTAPALTDLMAGRVDMIITTGAVAPISSGKVRPLAVTSITRIPALPEVPTFDEAGVKNFYMSSWYGLVAPAGTPLSRLEQLNAALAQALKNPALRQQFVATGSVPADPMSPEIFWGKVKKTMAEAAELVRISGAKQEN